MALTTAQKKALAEIAGEAVKLETQRNYPSLLLIVQWALESGWGSRTSGDFNYFGVTKAARHEKFKWVFTREVLTSAGTARLDSEERATITSQKPRPDGKFDVRLKRRFASYATLEEGLRDEINLISRAARYRPAFEAYQQDRNVEKLMRGIAAAGYATDPTYAQQLIAISRMSDVRSAIAAARAT